MIDITHKGTIPLRNPLIRRGFKSNPTIVTDWIISSGSGGWLGTEKPIQYNILDGSTREMPKPNDNITNIIAAVVDLQTPEITFILWNADNTADRLLSIYNIVTNSITKSVTFDHGYSMMGNNTDFIFISDSVNIYVYDRDLKFINSFSDPTTGALAIWNGGQNNVYGSDFFTKEFEANKDGIINSQSGIRAVMYDPYSNFLFGTYFDDHFYLSRYDFSLNRKDTSIVSIDYTNNHPMVFSKNYVFFGSYGDGVYRFNKMDLTISKKIYSGFPYSVNVDRVRKMLVFNADGENIRVYDFEGNLLRSSSSNAFGTVLAFPSVYA